MRPPFVDRAQLHARGGDGGNGAVSFRREPYNPRGGPDGGDGGNGGSVYLEADRLTDSLIELEQNPYRRAEDGGHGSSGLKRGRNGRDRVVKVPVGTVVYDKRGNLVAELDEPGKRVLVARGGRGGCGNAHFKSPQWRAPAVAERGEPGQDIWYDLELKVLADVGLIGFPNAGKSSLLSKLTNAKPKVAPYAFTTLHPQLGVVVSEDPTENRSILVADVPGILEGASEGVGLGIEFLRHIERCRLLVFVLDASGSVGAQPEEQLKKLERELEHFRKELVKRPRVVVANKIDLVGQARPPHFADLATSCVTGEGIAELKALLFERVSESVELKKARGLVVLRPQPRGIFIEREGEAFVVKGDFPERVSRFTDTSSPEVHTFVLKTLKRMGLDRLLRRAGARPGDTVRVAAVEFPWLPTKAREAADSQASLPGN